MLSLPDRDYYLNDDERSKKLREQYLAHVEKMFELLGDSPAQAGIEGGGCTEGRNRAGSVQLSRVDLRDPDKRYHVLTIAQLQALSPNYNWEGASCG